MPDPQSCHFATQHAMVRPEEMLGSNLVPGRHPPQVTLPELGGGCHSGPLKRRIFGRTVTPAGAAALAAGTTAGEQVLQQIFGSLDQRHLAHLNTLLDTIETGIVKAAQSTAVPSPCAQRP